MNFGLRCDSISNEFLVRRHDNISNELFDKFVVIIFFQSPSRVKISKVIYNRISGTSATQEIVKLVCSKGFPCQGVEVGEINVTYIGNQGAATSDCANVQPMTFGKQNPPICANVAIKAVPQ